MSAQLTVGVVQFAALPGALEQSLERAEALVAEASELGAELLVLPEFFSREYFCQYRDLAYLDYAESLENGPTISAVREWAKRHHVTIAAGIYERVASGLLYDSVVYVASDGSVVGRHAKVHPAAVRSLEKLYFRGGPAFSTVPINGWRVGANICYDIWFPEAARECMLAGAQLMIVPYASWREPLWREVLQVRAFENGMYLAVANKVGQEGDWTFGGLSLICDPEGTIVTECGGEDPGVVVATLDLDAVDAARKTYPMRRDRRPEAYSRIAALTE